MNNLFNSENICLDGKRKRRNVYLYCAYEGAKNKTNITEMMNGKCGSYHHRPQ